MSDGALAVLVAIMFLVAWSLFTFDPFLGVGLGILTAVLGTVAAFKTARSPQARSHEGRRVNWNDDHPSE